MTAEEIRDIRGMYGLTQKSFAQLLGIGVASIVRYEQGSEPSKANANLIRAARHPEFMLECLERDGDSITVRQREQATRCVYACISLDPEAKADQKSEQTNEATSSKAIGEKSERANGALSMDEVYHYTIQQEVLNEQAANIIGELISIKVSGGFKGLAGDVYDDLIDQVAEIKPSIISEESMDDCVLARFRGYLNCATDLVKRYDLGVA